MSAAEGLHALQTSGNLHESLSALLETVVIVSSGQSLAQVWLPEGEGIDSALVTAGPCRLHAQGGGSDACALPEHSVRVRKQSAHRACSLARSDVSLCAFLSASVAKLSTYIPRSLPAIAYRSMAPAWTPVSIPPCCNLTI